MGHINFRGSMEYSMWAMSGYDPGQISPLIWTPPYTLSEKDIKNEAEHKYTW